MLTFLAKFGSNMRKNLKCMIKNNMVLLFLYPGVLVEQEGKELHTLLLLQNREGKASAVHVVLFYKLVENY